MWRVAVRPSYIQEARFLKVKAYWLRNASKSSTFKNCTLCQYYIYVFCIYLRTNSDLSHLYHKLIYFYN